jgi:hypothetical protein
MAPIRRLTVLQEPADADDGRPPWHWTFIGMLFALSIWVPLAMLSSWIAGRAVHRLIGEGPPEAVAEQLAKAAGTTRLGLWIAVTAVLAGWSVGSAAVPVRGRGPSGPRWPPRWGRS